MPSRQTTTAFLSVGRLAMGFFTIILAAFALSACGMKGDLYLPDEAKEFQSERAEPRDAAPLK